MGFILDQLDFSWELAVEATSLKHISFANNWSLSELNLQYCAKGTGWNGCWVANCQRPFDNESYKISSQPI